MLHQQPRESAGLCVSRRCIIYNRCTSKYDIYIHIIRGYEVYKLKSKTTWYHIIVGALFFSCAQQEGDSCDWQTQHSIPGSAAVYPRNTPSTTDADYDTSYFEVYTCIDTFEMILFTQQVS